MTSRRLPISVRVSSGPLPLQRSDRTLMWVLWGIAVLLLIVGSVGEGRAEEALGTRPLLTIAPNDLQTILPQYSHMLIEPPSLEQFLDELDQTPPDWDLVCDHGDDDPGHDERLFTLNRERDAK